MHSSAFNATLFADAPPATSRRGDTLGGSASPRDPFGRTIGPIGAPAFSGKHTVFPDSCEIQKASGDGHGFVLLSQYPTPNHMDATPLPATPVKWKYRAIFRKLDARAGRWSDEVAMTVGG